MLSVHDPADGSWKAWKLPGDGPRTYAVYVDEKDKVWLTDFGANAIVRFDPVTGKFNAFPSDMAGANVRQLNGRPGETWGGESGTNPPGRDPDGRACVRFFVACAVLNLLAADPASRRGERRAPVHALPRVPQALIRSIKDCPAPISQG